MKKAILILLCCAMVTAFVSCNKSDEKSDKNIGENEVSNGETTNTCQSTYDKNIDINIYTDTDKTTFNNTDDSPQLKFYRTFQESVDSNSYDKWLETALSQGNKSEKEIYSNYLTLWKAEFLFTIQNGKRLFENEDDYIIWKTELEQWLVNAENILKIEMNSMEATLPQLEVIIPHCKLIRQKVIDTKKFLYYYGKEKLGMLDIHNSEILIKWRYDNQ